MFLRSLLFMLLLFLNTQVSAYELPVQIVENFENNRIVASIKESDIEASLRWTPFASPPPLLIADVVSLVQEYIDSDPRQTDAILKEIALKKIPHHENKWHYLIEIENLYEDKPQSYYYIVLMNGKVIPALKEPKP